VADKTSPVSGAAERYAKALFDLAVEENALAQSEAGLKQLGQLISDSADLKRLVKSPVFSPDEQGRAVAAILDKLGPIGIVANFVKVLTANRRLFILPDAIAAFLQMAARQRGELSAEVTSAEPLTDGQLASLRDALKASLGKDVALATQVDPALIGGLIVKVGSRMIDGSLRTKLNSLKLAMKEVG
jgi:F-type H+-transporting ATPase subunit delta